MPEEMIVRLLTARRTASEAQIDLRQRRVWRAEGDGQGSGSGGTDANADAGKSGTDPQKKDGASGQESGGQAGDADGLIDMIKADPTKTAEEIRKLRAEAAKHRKEAENAEAKRRAEEADRLKKAGEHEKLAEQYRQEAEGLKPKAERVDALEKRIQTMVDKRVQALPKEMRGLVPKYDDPAQTLDWLEANEAVLRGPRAPEMDGGAKGDPKGSGTKVGSPEHLKAVSERYNIGGRR